MYRGTRPSCLAMSLATSYEAACALAGATLIVDMLGSLVARVIQNEG